MTSLLEFDALEFSARAALCRHFAMLEPDSRFIWLAEAERWARLTKDNEDEPETPHVSPWLRQARPELTRTG